jgi:hypothetical protein
MTNIKTYKSVLSLALVFVLFVPAGIKVTHHLFVKHEQWHWHAHEHEHEHEHEGTVIDKVHKTCPICDFHFVEFFSDESPQLTGSPFALSDDGPAFIQQEISTEFLFLFHLRGPPLHS